MMMLLSSRFNFKAIALRRGVVTVPTKHFEPTLLPTDELSNTKTISIQPGNPLSSLEVFDPDDMSHKDITTPDAHDGEGEIVVPDIKTKKRTENSVHEETERLNEHP